jgi:ABC-type Fe3+-siderophore transport system permease subunit
MIDNGLSKTQLWMCAWLLALASLAAWVYLARHLDGQSSWDSGAVLALAVGVLGAIFSACCALLVAIKSAESRIRRAQSTHMDVER